MQGYKTTLIFIVGGITGFVLSLVFLEADLSEKTMPIPEGEIEVSLMVDSGQELITCHETLKDSEKTVFGLLESCAESENFEIDYKSYEGLGILVNSIAGGSSTENEFWQYWVNNEYAQVSADNFEVENGDVVLWKLTGQIEE